MHRLQLFIAFLASFSFHLHAGEPLLQKISQITYSEMGFEKAGEAYFSPDDKEILFQAVPKGQKDYQIYHMKLSEGIPRLVSTGIGACTCAFFHPLSNKIIFASSHSDPDPTNDETLYEGYKWELTPYMNIYEANRDGSDLVALTSGPAYHAECAYSPDGSHIVFASNEDGHMNLYIMESDGNGKRQLTHTRGTYNGGPFFSPDGKKIIFRADREKADYLQVYTLDLETGEEVQLTDNGAVNWAPYWHPNGEFIAFTTSLNGHHRYEIYLLNLITNELIRLTDHPGFDGLPVFSHDGKKLIWTSKRGQDGTCQIFIAEFINPFEEAR